MIKILQTTFWNAFWGFDVVYRLLNQIFGGSNWQQINTGWVNGLVPNKRQTLNSINDYIDAIWRHWAPMVWYQITQMQLFCTFNARMVSIVLTIPSSTGLTLGLRPANERRRYFVTTSFIGWKHAWISPEVRYQQCHTEPWLLEGWYVYVSIYLCLWSWSKHRSYWSAWISIHIE